MENSNNSYDLTQFTIDLSELGIILSYNQTEQFIKYYELLTEWNSFMNLTAITDFNEVLKKHFIDSLSIVKAVKDIDGYDFFEMNVNSDSSISIIDVGTGAGFPGIPLKIVFPHIKLTLLDSLQKRIKFLDKVILELSLKDVNTVHGRAEDYARPDKLRERYDLAVSRAVANLSTLSEYCIPFVRVGGKFISYKSEKLREEISDAEKAVSILGGRIQKQVDYTLPSSDIYRNLLLIDKITKTPESFPRKAGLPAKEPI